MNPTGEHVELRRLRALTRVMDEAVRIPGTRFRFGLDGVAGLIPGFGDALTAGISGYALLAAARVGAPGSVLVRMAGNILIDALVGAVPLLGDIFDFAFKANRRNLRILEHYTAAPARARRASRGLLAAAIVLLVLVLAGAVTVALLVGRALLGVLS